MIEEKRCEKEGCGGLVVEVWDNLDGNYYLDGARCVECGEWY